MLEVPKLDKLVKDTFCAHGNSIEITPLFGPKRRILLNRTAYHIDLTGKDLIVGPLRITLPILSENEEAEFNLSIVKTNVGDTFCLSGINGATFRINGTFSSHAYLRKGDEVAFGRNRIRCLSDDVEQEIGLDYRVHPKLNVLIEGETGTGKTHLAKSLHEQSGVCGNFVHLNLSSYSQNILESELFGHKKGAFTGALSDKDGALKIASGGTLFLDEIDSISKETQAKLLLFLDDGLFYPVGSNQAEFIKTRVIVASGRPLEKLVQQGQMRADFFFRVSSEEVIRLDSLRDCEKRLDQLLNSYEFKHGITIHPKLKRFYQNYSWPGNIRQLNAHLRKKHLKGKTNLLTYCEIDESLMKLNQMEMVSQDDHHFYSYREMKYHYFLKIYNHCDQNIKASAKVLGVTNQTLRTVLSI
ncbi:sigma 54-interacting transcriptional regulator [Halobacteriovorax sp. ZH5_bin.2]|uniref:sigma-54-dependent transcriptional regulator n=1 Tax=unclassified Halobacteriovorax TaxID=2639665 RepID=UPI003712ED27